MPNRYHETSGMGTTAGEGRTSGPRHPTKRSSARCATPPRVWSSEVSRTSRSRWARESSDLLYPPTRRRAHSMIASRSAPWVRRPVAAYVASLVLARSASRSAPAWLPRAAWVIATQTCAKPCHRSRSSGGPAFQRASRTSWAANGRPAATSSRAVLNVSSGGSGSSDTGSTPSLPYGKGRPSPSRGLAWRARPRASRSRGGPVTTTASQETPSWAANVRCGWFTPVTRDTE